ncbi:MAG: Maf family nucleotide pyrophosphatase [Bacteroidota bacterium]
MLKEKLEGKKIILGSRSPRRQQLLGELGIPFDVLLKEELDESFPENIKGKDIALYLANIKADQYKEELVPGTILITADTIVMLGGRVINKPSDRDDAFRMINALSGSMHTVATGVCVKSSDKTVSFYALTDVYFRKLTDEEIFYYIDNYKPYDKAGAYGIQEWIGYVAIERIDGSYFNVMGLPVQKLYNVLMNF